MQQVLKRKKLVIGILLFLLSMVSKAQQVLEQVKAKVVYVTAPIPDADSTIKAATTAWVKRASYWKPGGNKITGSNVFGTTNNRSLSIRTMGVERAVYDSIGRYYNSFTDINMDTSFFAINQIDSKSINFYAGDTRAIKARIYAGGYFNTGALILYGESLVRITASEIQTNSPSLLRTNGNNFTIRTVTGTVIVEGYNPTSSAELFRVQDPTIYFQNKMKLRIMKNGYVAIGDSVGAPLATLDLQPLDSNVLLLRNLATGISTDSLLVTRNGQTKKIASPTLLVDSPLLIIAGVLSIDSNTANNKAAVNQFQIKQKIGGTVGALAKFASGNKVVDAVAETDYAGTASMNKFINRVLIGTNANFTAIPGTHYRLPAATLTANRTIDVSNLNVAGYRVQFHNLDAGFLWTFTGGTVYQSDGTTVQNSLLYNITTVLFFDGSKIIIL